MIEHIANAIVQCGGGVNCDTGLPVVAADQSSIKVVLQLVFGIFGALMVLAFLIAVLRLNAAEGNPQESKKVYQAIIYISIGAAVALSAEALVTFVIKSV